MDWNVWVADGARDAVLLLIGAGVAWLSGISAAKRTEKSEQRQREAVRLSTETERLRGEEAARGEASAREARNALSVVFELDKALQKLPRDDASLPDHEIERLRAIGLLIPDIVARGSVSNFCDLANSWQLMVHWVPSGGPEIGATEKEYHSLLLVALREVLAATVRGDAPPLKRSGELEMIALSQQSALEDYWSMQAERLEEIRNEDAGRKRPTPKP